MLEIKLASLLILARSGSSAQLKANFGGVTAMPSLWTRIPVRALEAWEAVRRSWSSCTWRIDRPQRGEIRKR